ncbi:MAG: CRISPR-associated endoribonuclease Cas6 [Bacillota bacterium]
MRLKCDFVTDIIPISHNMMFVSLIKEALKKSNQEYFNKLYTFNGKANKRSKNFCFSVDIKDYEIEGDSMKVNDRVSFVVSSPDTEFLIYLYNGLLKIFEFTYKDYTLKRAGIGMLKEKDITSGEMLFKTLSPICVKNRSNYFMKIEDEGFAEELNYIANKVLENCRGIGLKEKLLFESVKMKKVVVREDIRGFEEKTDRQHMCINSYMGVFKLCGAKEDLRDLYALGLGFKRSQGFGMLDVVY